MKMFAILLVAPLAVFAGPSRAQAPGPVAQAAPGDGEERPGRMGFGMRALNPADFVLRHRADLALADSQIVAIGDIGARLDSLEKPIRDRLDSLRAGNHSSPGRYDGGRDAQRSQLRDALARMRQDRGAARAQILALLSPDQRRIAGELFDEERKKAEADGLRRGWGGGSGHGPWGRP